MRRALLAFVLAVLLAVGVVVAAIAFDEEEFVAQPPPASGTATDEWQALAPATLARTEVAAARIGRYIYVVGGFEEQSGETTGALERYDIERNSWRRLRPMPVGVNHPAAAAYRGRLYVHGGYTGRRDLSSATDALWRYSPGTQPLEAARGLAQPAGGTCPGGARRAAVRARAARTRAARWPRCTSTASGGTAGAGGRRFGGPARNHTTGVAAGGFFYVLAGRDSGNYAVAERFDPRTRQLAARCPTCRSRAAGSPRCGSAGAWWCSAARRTRPSGRSRSSTRDTRRWSRLPDMLTPRHGLGGAARGRRIYAIEGGPQPGFHFSNAIEFLDIR